MQQSDLRFTPAQLRALLWIPADGSWYAAPSDISAAMRSLHWFHPHLVQQDVDCGYPRLYRLTPAGIAERVRQRARVG